MSLYLFVDAETDGLYGPFLSVAALVTNDAGAELDRFYKAVRVELDSIRSAWVAENVYPFLSGAEELVTDESSLLEAFWSFWMRYREHALCVADVQTPVEARLFDRCIRMDPAVRNLLGPFPFFDLSTLLLARGIDWDADRKALSGLSLPQHNALNDVRITAAIWHKLLPSP